MKTHKNILFIILMLIIILLCGMFPTIAGVVQDSFDGQNINYEEIKSVQFSKKISTVEKFFLLSGGDIAAASEKKTKINAEKIRKTAEEALLPYVHRGMIRGDLSDFSIQYEPILYYNSEESDISSIFWMIDMTSYTESWSERIYLCIDDQTGKLMVISYECSEEIYPAYMCDELLAWFYSTYYGELDLSEEEKAWLLSKEITPMDETSAITSHMGDETYGELAIMFCVNSNGFYNSAV